VNYGCGTLRVCRHIIALLPAQSCRGLVIDDFLPDEGRR
jgi:hypothetical protein